MRTWNPAKNLALPLETAEPTEWIVVGLFDGSDEEIAARFAVMAACSHHRFRALTDRLDRAREWFRYMSAPTDAWRRMRAHEPSLPVQSAPLWPLPNLMLGTTVCTQADADRLLPMLAELPAAFRFARVEPSGRISLDDIKLEGNSHTGWRSLSCSQYWTRRFNALTGEDQRGPWNDEQGRRWSDSRPEQLPALDLIKIAGGPGPEQRRIVQAIGRQVLAAQNFGRMEMLHDGPVWRDELVSGPALAIVANDPDSTVHGSHPYVEIAGQRQRWNQQPLGWRA